MNKGVAVSEMQIPGPSKSPFLLYMEDHFAGQGHDMQFQNFNNDGQLIQGLNLDGIDCSKDLQILTSHVDLTSVRNLQSALVA